MKQGVLEVPDAFLPPQNIEKNFLKNLIFSEVIMDYLKILTCV